MTNDNKYCATYPTGVMFIYTIGASGFHAAGTAVVKAQTPERCAELANESSDPHFNLTYHAMNAQVVEESNSFWRDGELVTIREYGHPELPSGYNAGNWQDNKYT